MCVCGGGEEVSKGNWEFSECGVGVGGGRGCVAQRKKI